MMNAADFWERAHAHWDARRDPLDDEGVRVWLQAHPEELEEFATVRASILDLKEAKAAVNEVQSAVHEARTAVTTARPAARIDGLGRHRWIGAAIAASLLLAILLFEAWHPDPTTDRGPTGAPDLVSELDVGAARVLSFDMRVTTSWPNREVVTRATADGQQREHSLTVRSNPTTTPPWTAHWRVARNQSFQP